ncbi:MAG: hypothetical protein ACYS29_01305 [Planctomycetota bacterium]|jgi:4-amino-4-deoxy-L-arabinose transferase-like glycosyltransferase
MIFEQLRGKVQLKIVVSIFLLVVGSFCYLLIKAAYDPAVPFLRTDRRANWIMYRLPPALGVRDKNFINLSTEFTKDFELVSVPSKGYLHIKAFKECDLWINDDRVSSSSASEGNWKKPSVLEISRFLKEGSNAIKVRVTCDYGPPALWLYSEGLANQVKTDNSWSVSIPGRSAVAARLADDCLVHPSSLKAMTPYEAFAKKLPMLTLFFGISFAVFWLQGYKRKITETNGGQVWGFLSFSPKSVLGLSIFLWMILFIRNSGTIPLSLGFDAPAHLQYVEHVLVRHSLPELDNPPLFYLACAAIYRVTGLFISQGYAAYSLKLIPFLCGIGQICMAYFASGIFFPKSKTKQALTVAMAAMIPMNIYMSHYISNETLCAFLMGLSLLVAIMIVDRNRSSLALFCILGLVVGLALLAKMTALTVLPVIFLVLLYKLVSEKQCHRFGLMKYLGSMSLIIIVVAGWFYLRSWMHFGKAFVGIWDHLLVFEWWQDPGFHTYKYFCQFGRVFSLPYYAAFYSFFDSIYSTFWGDGLFGGQGEFANRPPWNYEYMSVVYLLAVPATLAIVIGTVRVTADAVFGGNKLWLPMLGSIFVLFYSIAYMCLRIPIYSMAKAFYGLSAILPISLIFASGFYCVDKWLKNKNLSLIRAVLYGWLGTLALTIYFTFLVRSA